jgi:hypothetical protein
MAAWLLLLAIAVAAIMPHARQRSKRKGRHASTIAAYVFRKAEWWGAAKGFHAVVASAAKQSRIPPR